MPWLCVGFSKTLVSMVGHCLILCLHAPGTLTGPQMAAGDPSGGTLFSPSPLSQKQRARPEPPNGVFGAPWSPRSSSLRENYSTGIWPLGHSQVVALLSTKTAGFGDRSWV